MSNKILRSLLATSAITLALPTMAAAQDAQADGAASASFGEIIVTARRGDEKLQDVPVSVQVVSGDKLQKLAITSADEISKLAPGLTLVSNGSSTAVVLRGVLWQPGSGTPATPIYFNEIPFNPGDTLNSLFDVGQIEVLRGPQGTTRGAPSISGAVTITTRKPVLDEFGGYVQGLYGSGDHWDAQGAINVPIIRDVLAIRLAANIEESDGNRIYSVNSSIQPKLTDRSYRATVLFEPTDTISVQAMYQRRKSERLAYSQVVGNGSPGFAAIGIPANFNGPALTLGDRASVQDQPSDLTDKYDLLTINASWDVVGHKLSANYGRGFNRGPFRFNAVDFVNALPGFEAFTSPGFPDGVPKFEVRELRISSLPDPDRPFDYDMGWYSKSSDGRQAFRLSTYLPGSFGPPAVGLGTPGLVTTPLSRYTLDTNVNIGIGQQFDSFYGNARFYLTDNTELSGGLAILRDRVPVSSNIENGSAIFLFANPFPAGSTTCPGTFAVSVDYGPRFCERPLSPTVSTVESFNNKYSYAIYNFGEDLLVYATTGSSFRTGLPSINNPGLPSSLLLPEPETAKSYELGVKASLGRRLRFSAAVFQLDYKDNLKTFEGTPFFSSIPGAGVRRTNVAFYRNIDARIRGFEMEVAAEPIDNLSLSANLSYSKNKGKGGLVPCDNGTVTAANPTGDLSPTNPIDFCDSPPGEVLNTSAPFQASANGSYNLPIGDMFDGYFRFNVSYQGKNPNFGNFRNPVDGSFKKTGAYAIVDLFVGVTGSEGAWDLGVYAKNVFDKQVELSRLNVTNSLYPLFAADDGYDVVQSSRPREIGVSVRYAFGSR